MGWLNNARRTMEKQQREEEQVRQRERQRNALLIGYQERDGVLIEQRLREVGGLYYSQHSNNTKIKILIARHLGDYALDTKSITWGCFQDMERWSWLPDRIEADIGGDLNTHDVLRDCVFYVTLNHWFKGRQENLQYQVGHSKGIAANRFSDRWLRSQLEPYALRGMEPY